MSRLRKRMEQEFALRGSPRNTQETYLRCIKTFAAHFGRSPARLGREHVRAFLLYLVEKRKLSPSSHNVYVGALRFLYIHVLRRPEVVEGIPRRKQIKKIPRVLSASEVEELLAAIGPMTQRTILMLAYGAGLRVSEACHLQVEDIDSRQMVVHVRNAKRNRERDVMLSPRLLQQLRAYWRHHRPPGPHLFPGRGRNPTLTRDSVYDALHRARQRCGLKGPITPHTMRHSFATHLLQQGVDLRTVQVLLGHASIRSTTHYTQVTTARLASLQSPLDGLGNLSAQSPI